MMGHIRLVGHLLLGLFRLFFICRLFFLRFLRLEINQAAVYFFLFTLVSSSNAVSDYSIFEILAQQSLLLVDFVATRVTLVLA